jgi:hypothetical protein
MRFRIVGVDRVKACTTTGVYGELVAEQRINIF